jgi:hypothetical protein
MGVYPLLQNETCCFLAVDFDSQGVRKTASPRHFPTEQPETNKLSWQEDAKAFMETCQAKDIPASLERSRSGNGAHIWVFFEKPIPAVKARKLGSLLMTRTLDRRPEIGLDSFDRFFPSQDTLPKAASGILSPSPCKRRQGKRTTLFS